MELSGPVYGGRAYESYDQRPSRRADVSRFLFSDHKTPNGRLIDDGSSGDVNPVLQLCK